MRRHIFRWPPPPDLASVRDAMDRLVEESFVRAPRRLMEPILGYEPPVDIYETAQAVVVLAPIPGVKPEDLDITILGDTLTIRGQMQRDPEATREQYIRREINYGEFSRSVTLPHGLETDNAEAQFQNGMLRLTIPKAEKVRPKVIHVQAAQ